MINTEFQSILQEAIENNKQGKYEIAERLCTESLFLLPAEEKHLRVDFLTILVNSLWRCGRTKEALLSAEEALAISIEIDDTFEIAEITNLIGSIYDAAGDYASSLENYKKALTLFNKLDNKQMAGGTIVNIGSLYHSLGDFTRALEYYQQAISIFDEIEEKSFRAIAIGNIGSVHSSLGNDVRALEYYTRAVEAFEELNMKTEIVIFTSGIARSYYSIKEYSRALEYYYKTLMAFEELGMTSDIARITGEIGSVLVDVGDYAQALEYLLKALATHEELGTKLSIANVLVSIGGLYANKKFQGYDPIQAEETLLHALQINHSLQVKPSLYSNHRALAKLYEHEMRWQDALLHYKEYHKIESEVHSEEATKQAQQMEHRRKIEEAERDRQIKLARFQEQEKILHKTLPPIIADRLISGEKDIADRYESVSILFADIVGFTPLSERKTPREVVHILNNIFSRFDAITKKYGVERIKTIGDAYMVVAGAPHVVEDHAFRLAQTAFAMLEAIAEFNKASGESINLRIGVNSGEAMAAVVGEVKFTYDLWSDAVNIASRMESHGEPGKIHCTENFILLLGECEFYAFNRGEIEIKGKGKMKTYFLEKA